MGVIEKEKIAALLFRRLDNTEDELFLYSGLRKEKGIILVLVFGDDSCHAVVQEVEGEKHSVVIMQHEGDAGE